MPVCHRSGLVGQSVVHLNSDIGVSKLQSQLGQVTSLKSDHKIISKVIHNLPLFQEKQLSVTGKSLCTSTG